MTDWIAPGNLTPTTMYGVVNTTADAECKVTLRQDLTVPKPAPGEVLVRIHAAGLNPTDWKHALYFSHVIEGTVSGCDFAGEVVALGDGVEERKLGQRVAGSVHGSNALQSNIGAFAEYTVIAAALTVVIPDEVSDANAAGQPAAIISSSQILWQSHSLPTPENPGDGMTDFLVWSGATGVGQWLIQLATLSGLRVITTASIKHTEYLKKLGAVEVIDYRDPSVTAKIREATSGKLLHAAVCEIPDADFHTKLLPALANAARVSVLAPQYDVQERKDVQVVFSNAYTVHGKEMKTPGPVPAIPSHFEDGKQFVDRANALLAQGKIQLIPVRVVGGLDRVWDAFEEMRQGKVSGERIVFKV